ncbi:CPBP family intramembrane metalloprotease [Paenibacillus sp. sptzw28]|uniref:CPBP family intramembrane glutamic endopeptidase n=1 Tax=Paenibacillus sp. sptzw28 TaxID=715179 RepID=UPI001C6F4DA3|nr:type II CAAX endopeptidase family protein [Paenibacillus sp. sptzw28]QYR21391.1 CPBP family intramembrane metalloprotease [Paenibacillus sp. sptzw28]
MKKSEQFKSLRFLYFAIGALLLLTVSVALSLLNINNEISQHLWNIYQFVLYGTWAGWMFFHFKKLGVIGKDLIGENLNGHRFITIFQATIIMVFIHVFSYLIQLKFFNFGTNSTTEISFRNFSWRTTSVEDIISLLIVLFIAPIIEEIYFRRVLLQRWSSKWGPKRAIILSSIVFSLLHADILGKFIFSIVLSLLILKTNSLLVPIVVHILNNLIFSITPLIIGSSVEFILNTYINSIVIVIIFALIFLYLKRLWTTSLPESNY